MTSAEAIDSTTTATVALRVNLPGAGADALGGILTQVRAYGESLVRALELGINFEVTADADPGQRPMLLIGDRSAAIESPLVNDTMADAACDALWRSRELLLTVETASTLRAAWTGRPDTDDDPQIHWLARQCLRGGFRTGRLRSAVRQRRVAGCTHRELERVFEEAIGPMGSCTVQLRLATSLYSTWIEGDDSSQGQAPPGAILPALLDTMRDGLFYEIGVLIPRVLVRPDESLPPGSFAATINDSPLSPHRALQSTECLVNETPDRLALLGIDSREARNPANFNACAIVSTGAEGRAKCDGLGLTTWNACDHAVLQLSADIRRAAGGLVNTAIASHMLERVRESLPRLVEEAQARFDEVTIVRTLRLLVEDGISIRDLRAVLGGMLSVEGTSDVDSSKFIVFAGAQGFQYPSRQRREVADLHAEELAECVRVWLKRYISHKFAHGPATLIVYLVEPAIETMLNQDHLPSRDAARIVRAVLDELGSLPTSAQMPVILTVMEVRRRLRGIIACAAPRLQVLSYQELSPDMNIKPIARITLDEELPAAPS